MKYYISHEGAQQGPWSAEEVLNNLGSKSIQWTDYLFDEGSKEWVLLMEHSEFSKFFKDWIAPQKANPGEGSGIVELPLNNEKEWFVLKGENKYGPFGYSELLKMLQEKGLYEYDFVWHSELSAWKRIADLEDFKADKIKALSTSTSPDLKDAFFRRRYARASYNASLIVHNSKSVWKGHGLEISSGGAGIVIDNRDLEPGQTLFLHFKAGDGVPPFNAICSIVSKQHVDGPEKPVRYGVKFTSINHQVQQAIKAFADHRKSAA